MLIWLKPTPLAACPAKGTASSTNIKQCKATPRTVKKPMPIFPGGNRGLYAMHEWRTGRTPAKPLPFRSCTPLFSARAAMYSHEMRIAGYDDELARAMREEKQRQEDHVELIASENYASP